MKWLGLDINFVDIKASFVIKCFCLVDLNIDLNLDYIRNFGGVLFWKCSEGFDVTFISFGLIGDRKMVKLFVNKVFQI